MSFERALVIINNTRLESLIERFNTRAQAKFFIEHSGGDFAEYEEEHDVFHRALDQITSDIQKEIKAKVIERKFLPDYLFSSKDIIVVVGQDGLVANTAKYAGDIPILAINPDPARMDGILLPFQLQNYLPGFREALAEKAAISEITLAEARSNDGQRLLAFNDFFIGPASHVSARYKIHFRGKMEKQSSSGIIVSTGAGSTGWFSSVVNMARGVSQTFTSKTTAPLKDYRLPWNTDRLAFVVREPFQSKHSQIGICAGLIQQDEKLIIESEMPVKGVVFSDGVETDFIHFNAGVKVEVKIAPTRAKLIAGKDKKSK